MLLRDKRGDVPDRAVDSSLLPVWIETHIVSPRGQRGGSGGG